MSSDQEADEYQPANNLTAELFGSDDEEEPQPNEAALRKQKLAELSERKRLAQDQPQEEQDKKKRKTSEDADKDPVVGEGSEQEEDLVRTAEDDAFINDEGVPEDERWGSADEDDGQAPEAEEAEEGEDELEAMFAKKGRQRESKSHQEIKALVESFLAKMEVAAELDIEANQQHKPAIHKLKLLSEVEQVMARRDLQQEFLDGGVLGVLKAWVEPLPDASLPNVKIRTSVLKILHQLPFFFEDRKEQLKKSGLGKVIMFLYKLPDETPGNRRLAKELVERWSRPIFEQYRERSQNAEDMEEEMELRRERARRSREAEVAAAGDEGLDVDGKKPVLKPGDAGFRWHASIPQAARLDYTRKPVSKVAAVAASPMGQKPSGKTASIQKKLKDLDRKAKGKFQRTAKVSVEGRGLII